MQNDIASVGEMIWDELLKLEARTARINDDEQL
jgi:hypothetical protein